MIVDQLIEMELVRKQFYKEYKETGKRKWKEREGRKVVRKSALLITTLGTNELNIAKAQREGQRNVGLHSQDPEREARQHARTKTRR